MEENAVFISDIIEALLVIKRECAKHSECGDCCFYSKDETCNITDHVPSKWELESKYIWRAFK